jgi:periplasmic protein TonB
VFEDAVLNEKKNNRPLAFLVSISAELVVVSALILIPLAYNDHLPGFQWKNIGLGPPARPIEPKSLPVQPLRRASGSTNMHTRFIPSSLPSARPAASPGSETIEAPPVPGGVDVGGSSPNLIVDIPVRLASAPPPRPKPEPAPTAQTHQPIRVASTVQMAKLVRKVVPPYPPLARAARISGVVHLIGIIARDGAIRNLQLVSGHPLLTRAAIEAVQQWIYQPTLLNGEPVEVIAPIDVNFTLGDR